MRLSFFVDAFATRKRWRADTSADTSADTWTQTLAETVNCAVLKALRASRSNIRRRARLALVRWPHVMSCSHSCRFRWLLGGKQLSALVLPLSFPI